MLKYAYPAMNSSLFRKCARAVFVMAIVLCFLAFSHADILFAAAPTVTTGAASSITKTTATIDYTIGDDGGKGISTKGVEYGTTVSYGSSSNAAPFVYDNAASISLSLGNGSAESELLSPYDHTVDASGNLIFVDTDNNRIQKIDSSGVFQFAFGWGVDTGANSFEICTSTCQAGISGSGNGQFNQPTAIALDSSGNIYVLDAGGSRVQKFNSSGVYQSQFGSAGTAEGQFSLALGLEVDSSGNIYVADTDNYRIQKFNSSGVFQFAFGWGVDTGANSFEICTSTCQAGISGSGNGQFNFDDIDLGLGRESGLAVDSSGNIYVLDAGNSRVQKFNSSGVYQSQFGSAGTAEGQFNNLADIYIDQNDDIYILDVGEQSSIDIDRLQKFDSSFNQYSSYTIAVSGSQLAAMSGYTAAGTVYVLYYSPGISVINQFSGSVSLSGLTCGTTYHYRAFATNADGTSYGSDATFDTLACDVPTIQTKAAMRIGKKSAILTGVQSSDGVGASTVRGFQYGTTDSYGSSVNFGYRTSLSPSSVGFNGTGDAEFDDPGGIVEDEDGNFYIADTGNNRIQLIDASGTLVRMFGWGVSTGASAFETCTSGCQAGISGSGNGQFNSPRGVSIDQLTGDLYVADSGNNRIQVFSSDGVYESQFGSTGSGPGQFDSPRALVVISNSVYVVDTNNSRVQKLSTTGTMLDEIGAPGIAFNVGSVVAIAGNTDDIYVLDDGNVWHIDRLSMDATLVTFPTTILDGVQSSALTGIAIDDNNNLYLSDVPANRIIFAVRGADATHYEYIAAYAGSLAQPGQLTISQNNSTNTNNRVLRVSDATNDNIAVFSPFMDYELKPLQCNTTYHYRAFATNSDGTDYGDDVTFTTLSNCGTLSGSGGGGQTDPPAGCTDPTAINYDPVYVVDDGSCQPRVYGCINYLALNYNPAVTDDDGSCLFGPPPTPGCMNPLATNYNAAATVDDGTCTLPGGGGPDTPDDVFGCTDTFANNYNPNATIDDGVSCEYSLTSILGCMIPTALNYNPNATVSDGSCEYPPPPWFPPVITEIIDTINDVIGDVTGWTPEEQANTYTDVAVAGLVVPSIWFLLANRTALVSIPLRLWNIIPTLLGFRRKRRPWGTVYDSVTKQPLDPVYVRLYDSAYAEAATSITDLDGRYGFAPIPGTYTMDAKKGDYAFPSAKLKDVNHDELYDDLYFGGTLEVENEDSIIAKNIPMDAINFNWNEFEKAKRTGLMKFYSRGELFLSRIAKVLFIAGFVASFLLIFLEPRLFNYIILGVYVVISVLSLFGVRPRRPGFVVERATGAPLSFAILSVFSELLKKEVAHTIVGATGRYHVLVPKGRYYVTLKKKIGEQTYKDIYTSDVFKARKGYIDKVIKV